MSKKSNIKIGLLISLISIINIFCVYNFVFAKKLNIVEKTVEYRCNSTLNGNITLNKNYTCIGNAFALSSNTILNCNGHSINGGSTSNGNIGIGINLNNATNVTIKNCNINGFQYGIKLENSSSNNIYFNHFNNTINAYESETSSNNIWYSTNSQAGNFWSDFLINSGYPNSYIVSGDGDGIDNFPNPTVSNPIASQESGIINFESFVSLSTQTPNAQIRYTIDGSNPNQNSLLYINPIQITQSTTTTIKAIAYRTNYAPSNIVEYSYVVLTANDAIASQESGIVDYETFISLSTQTPGATIRYTTNGSNPTPSSTIYTNPIQINSNTILKAKTYKNGYIPSNISTYNYTIQTVSDPIASQESGVVDYESFVSFSTQTPSSTIRYTTDGSNPTPSSTIYTNPIQILSSTTTIKSRAYKNTYAPSNISTYTYLVLTASTPVASQESGVVNQGSFISLSTQTASATIRYTLDGTSPTPSSTIYTNPVQINTNTILKAKTFKNGYIPSNISIYNYTVINPGSCGSTINENFTLTSDINCSNNIPIAFNIGANNIIFDCNGFSINGSSDSNDYGIQAISKSGITIKNCKINNFARGISLGNTTSSTFYNNHFNNTINAYEDINSINNSWNFNNQGNYWYDYDNNSTTPEFYTISGNGNGIDNFPKPRLINLSCGDSLAQSATLSNNITCGMDQWVSLTIPNNDITIDCNGHSIIGSPGIDDWGINILGRDNIVIRNCVFSGLNFPIYHEDGSYNIIENNTFNGTRHGPILRKGSYNTIKNNTILNTEMDGIGVIGYLNDEIPSHHNQVLNNTVTNCGSDYASIDISYGWNNLIDGNIITGTGQYDNSIIMVNAVSNNNTTSNNWGTNGDYGFWVTTGSTMNTFFHNYISNSAYVGIYIDSGTSQQTIYQNTVLNSGQNNAFQESPADETNWEFNGIGNYWGDHNCIDSDNNGICENQYNFPGDSDFHPLSNPTWNTTTTRNSVGTNKKN